MEWEGIVSLRILFFGIVSAKNILKQKDFNFPISELSVEINNKMPLNILMHINKKFKSIKNKKILIIGASYKSGIDDVRFSPTKILAENLQKYNVNLKIYDQYVKDWDQFKKNMINTINKKDKFDIIILTIRNNFYKKINLENISIPKKTFIIDANNVLNLKSLIRLKAKKIRIFSVGRGYIE